MDANSRLIADLYVAFVRGDIAFILERLSEDVRFEHSDSPEVPYGGRYDGKDAVLDFFGRVDAAVEVTSFEPESYVAAGDEVMTAGVETGVARATGRAFTNRWAMRFLVRDGKVSYARIYDDSAVLAAALRV
jgi:ketosteroid isomerase-like protein